MSDSGPEIEGETLSTDTLSDVDMIPSCSVSRPATVASSSVSLVPADIRIMDPSGPTAARLLAATAATARIISTATIAPSVAPVVAPTPRADEGKL